MTWLLMKRFDRFHQIRGDVDKAPSEAGAAGLGDLVQTLAGYQADVSRGDLCDGRNKRDFGGVVELSGINIAGRIGQLNTPPSYVIAL